MSTLGPSCTLRVGVLLCKCSPNPTPPAPHLITVYVSPREKTASRDTHPLLPPFTHTRSLGCIGQQNGYDAAAEIAASAAYPSIRTMTVGETTTSYTPLQELAVAPTLPWSVAGPASIGAGNWSATSAVWCVGLWL